MLVVVALAFFGCKQMAHIEKDTHEIEPTGIDSAAIAKPRITDTITMVFDTIAPDTTAQFVVDSIASLDSLAVALDTIPTLDSLGYDTLTHKTKK